ncbi:unnamed protein product [Blepharisma stoltei]|uniref:Uncharacterized protein n=1 Tax=Blepharisma stoltei TaxID=1481888 RepID=A0AAU9K973_9CILI|nr:unnamed protein product [Blepharisma stoltei]
MSLSKSFDSATIQDQVKISKNPSQHKSLLTSKSGASIYESDPKNKKESQNYNERLRSLSKPRHNYSDESGDEIGPGQYDTNDIYLSTNHRSPSVKIYKSHSPITKTKTENQSLYHPNFEIIQPSVPKPYFSKAEVKRLSFFEDLGYRSPGPKYMWNLPSAPSWKFGLNSHNHSQNRVKINQVEDLKQNNTKFGISLPPVVKGAQNSNNTRSTSSQDLPSSSHKFKIPGLNQSSTKAHLFEEYSAINSSGSHKYSFSKAKRDLNWKKLKGFKDNIRFFTKKLK